MNFLNEPPLHWNGNDLRSTREWIKTQFYADPPPRVRLDKQSECHIDIQELWGLWSDKSGSLSEADKHFVAMLTFCGEIIEDQDDHNNHLEAEEKRGESWKTVLISLLPCPEHGRLGALNHYIQIITLLKMQTRGPRILFGNHYVDAVSTLELLPARPRRGFS